MTDRQFTEDKLVIATHNVGKMREIEALFAHHRGQRRVSRGEGFRGHGVVVAADH